MELRPKRRSEKWVEWAKATSSEAKGRDAGQKAMEIIKNFLVLIRCTGDLLKRRLAVHIAQSIRDGEAEGPESHQTIPGLNYFQFQPRSVRFPEAERNV